MGFCTGTTAALGHFEGQQRFVLGHAMNLHTMVWILGLCLSLHRHCCDQLMFLGAEDSSHGTPQSTSMEEGIHAMVGELKRISQFEPHVMEECCTQHFDNASASSHFDTASGGGFIITYWW